MLTALMSLALLGVVAAGAIYYATAIDEMLSQSPKRDVDHYPRSN